MTPLMRAVWRQLPELVSIVAEAGAELDLMNNVCSTVVIVCDHYASLVQHLIHTIQ